MPESPPEIIILDRHIEPNRSMLIADEAIRERVRDITWALIGRGEPLS